MGLYALGDLWRTNEFRTHLPQAWCRDPGCAELDQSGRRVWRRHDPGSSVRSGLGDELLHMALEEDSLARAPFRREAVGAEGALQVVAKLPVLSASHHLRAGLRGRRVGGPLSDGGLRRGRDARAGAR